MPNVIRRNAAGLTLTAFHSAHVLWTWWWVATHPGFLSGLSWLPVAVIDFPLTIAANLFLDDMLDGPTATGLTFLLGGGLYWMVIGAAVQAGCRRFLRRLEWG